MYLLKNAGLKVNNDEESLALSHCNFVPRDHKETILFLSRVLETGLPAREIKTASNWNFKCITSSAIRENDD